MITKAIIPVAGWGTRRLPITKIIEKSMLPVGNRPLVDYSVQELIKAGVKDIYMVISNVEPCQVQEFYKDNLALNQYLIDRGKEDRLKLAKTLPDDVTIHYTVQDPADKYGTAVPIAMVVKEYSINEPVLVFMGDDFIWNPNGESAAEALIKSVKEKTDSAILGVEIDKSKVDKYGVLSVEDDKLVGVVEKPTPEEAPTNLINVSKYILSPELLQIVHGPVRTGQGHVSPLLLCLGMADEPLVPGKEELILLPDRHKARFQVGVGPLRKDDQDLEAGPLLRGAGSIVQGGGKDLDHLALRHQEGLAQSGVKEAILSDLSLLAQQKDEILRPQVHLGIPVVLQAVEDRVVAVAKAHLDRHAAIEPVAQLGRHGQVLQLLELRNIGGSLGDRSGLLQDLQELLQIIAGHDPPILSELGIKT